MSKSSRFLLCLLAIVCLLLCGGAGTAQARTYTSVSAGYVTTCGITAGEALVCWGALPPEGLPTGSFTAVGAGYYFACALRSAGSIACWGVNWFGQATPPPGDFTAVDAGEDFACGLRTDGSLACWGSPAALQHPGSRPRARSRPSPSATITAARCALTTRSPAGVEPVWAGDAAAGAVRLGHRRREPHLRRALQRRARVLGRELRGADERAAGPLPRRRRRRRLRLRGAGGPDARLLGPRQLRADVAPGGDVHGRQLRLPAQLRDPHRRHRRLLGRRRAGTRHPAGRRDAADR